MSKRKKGRTSRPEVPHSLAEASTYLSGIADRSEEVSRRLRSASDFLAQVVEVEEGVKRGARRIFRPRTLVILVVVVVAAFAVRAYLQSSRPKPPSAEAGEEPAERPHLAGTTTESSGGT